MGLLRRPWLWGVIAFTVLRVLLSPLVSPTVCRDGWPSPSIGHRGACSHHGGIGTNWSALVVFVLSVTGGVTAGKLVARHEGKRLAALNKHRVNERTQPPRARLPSCPRCGTDMRLRLAKKGRHRGQHFGGCSSYPRCKVTRPFVTAKQRADDIAVGDSKAAHIAFHSYSEFRNATVTCPRCGWSGQGRQMKVGEVYEGGQVSEYHCPRCEGNGDYLAVAPWPQIGESQE